MISLRSETSGLEISIADQETALAALSADELGRFTAKNLAALRKKRPRAVETLEAMSAALPDDAYLVSFQLSADQLQIIGVAKEISKLVPALEGSKHFLDVSFAEATTRLEDGSANRFHLSMRVASSAQAVSP
jgi:Tfp pilus assembly protein PilN